MKSEEIEESSVLLLDSDDLGVFSVSYWCYSDMTGWHSVCLMERCMKIKKELRKQCDKLNGVICSQNLYSVAGGRYYNAEVVNGVLTVESLHSGDKVPFEDGKFRNGYGTVIFLDNI